MTLSNTWKTIIIVASILLLIVIGASIAIAVYNKKIADQKELRHDAEMELVKEKQKRVDLNAKIEVYETRIQKDSLFIVNLIKNKPIIKKIPNAPINYSLPANQQDSLFNANYNRFKQGGI